MTSPPMNMENWEKVKRIFLHAASLSAAEQHVYLGEACATRPDLLEHVTSLLAFDVDSPNVMARAEQAIHAVFPAVQPPALATFSEETPPEMIGSCRVLSLLGAGASGLVYLAEQARPRRQVAIKVLRQGQTTPAGLRRLEREAEIMARMRHVGIAQVFETGTGQSGAYFMMEYVPGTPVTRYCRDRNLSVNDRLHLFLLICDAVQHAHSMGIIHRDLKPANILVTSTGAPKVLDFGIARAIDADARQATMATSLGSLVGTLAYMSPEQAGGDAGTVDARTDVYALGGILHELLAGKPPLDIRDKPLHEAIRIIQQSPVPRLGSFSRALRGDIETIVAKTLEKSPIRRYASVSELASDVRRHLDRLPIHARPPSTIYELKRFTDRHRSLVAGAAIAFTGVIAALGWSLFARHREHQNYLMAKSVAASLGEVLAHLGPVRGAHPARRAMLAEVRPAVEQVALHHPEDPDMQGNLAAIAYAEGDLASESGDDDKALTSYMRARDILADLSHAYPSKIRWRLYHSTAAVKIGDILYSRGDRVQAAQWHIAALAIDDATAHDFPDDYTANDQLFWSYDRLAHRAMHLRSFDNAARLVACLNNVSNHISSKWPDEPKGIWCRVCAIETSCALMDHIGNREGAREGRLLSFDLLRKLIAEVPTNRGYVVRQIHALSGAAEHSIAVGSLQEARAFLDEAQPFVASAVALDGHDPATHEVAATYFLTLTACHARLQQREEAKAAVDRALTHIFELARQGDDSYELTNRAVRFALVATRHLAGPACAEQGDTVVDWIIETINDLAARFPDHPGTAALTKLFIEYASPTNPQYEFIAAFANRPPTTQRSPTADTPSVIESLHRTAKQDDARDAVRREARLIDVPGRPPWRPLRERLADINVPPNSSGPSLSVH